MAEDYGFQPDDDFGFILDKPAEDNRSTLQRWNESWINQGLLGKGINWVGHQLGVPEDVKVYDPREAANYYDPKNADPTKQWHIPEYHPEGGNTALEYIFGVPKSWGGGGTWRSLLAGGIEGAGNTVDSLSSPLNLATLGAARYAKGVTAGAQALQDLGKTAEAEKALSRAVMATKAEKAMMAPFALSGAAKTYKGLSDRDLGEAGLGVAELAGGIAELSSTLLR